MFPIHKELSKLYLIKTQMDFDATSLYPSAMWDKISLYPKIKTGFAFKPRMNDVFVETFKNKTFNQDGNESGILKLKYYNPANPIFQHWPVKEKVKNIEVLRRRSGSIIATLTSVEICKIVKLGGKVSEIWEAVIHRENFRISLFRIVIEKVFSLRQENTDKKMV